MGDYVVTARKDRNSAEWYIGGGTDAAYAYHADSDKPAVLESLGLVGGGYHSDQEFVLVDSVVPRLYLTTRMIMQLSEDQPQE